MGVPRSGSNPEGCPEEVSWEGSSRWAKSGLRQLELTMAGQAVGGGALALPPVLQGFSCWSSPESYRPQPFRGRKESLTSHTQQAGPLEQCSWRGAGDQGTRASLL